MLARCARGLTTGEIAAHFEEAYGATVSSDTISKITEKISPLYPLYPVRFVDAIVVKVRDGQVRNTPIYVVIGEGAIFGIWAGTAPKVQDSGCRSFPS